MHTTVVAKNVAQNKSSAYLTANLTRFSKIVIAKACVQLIGIPRMTPELAKPGEALVTEMIHFNRKVL